MNQGTENQSEIDDLQTRIALRWLREIEHRMSGDISRMDKMSDMDPNQIPLHLIEHLSATANAIEDALKLVREARAMMNELVY